MNTIISRDAVADSDVLLSVTPPRVPRNLLARPRLGLEDKLFRDRPITVVQAPPGFGKTSLLVQWRREHLARGAAVAWISADGRDDPIRLLHRLVFSVRVGCGRPAFGRTLFEGAVTAGGHLEGMTGWLAEVALTPLNLVLILDEAERLSAGGHAALTYLLHNAPSNLSFVIAARSGVTAAVADLCAYGQCVCVGPGTLRFRLEETIALVRSLFGAKVDADACARLHELADGWPLGLQLALAEMEHATVPQAAIKSLSAHPGDQGEQLIGALVAKLAPDDETFLTRIAVVDRLDPDLCRAITGLDEAPERLARLIRDTPLFVVDDAGDWCRLHTLVHSVLRTRLAKRPGEEQADLHRRAMHWLADHGMLEAAARHAIAAGQRDIAYELAERCFYDAVMQARPWMVLEWLAILPDMELERRPRLQLAIAWALSLSERHAEAERWVARIFEQPDVDATLRYECALIVSAAAYYADAPDHCLALFEPWIKTPPTHAPRLLQIHANRMSMLAILQGDPAQARLHQQRVPHDELGCAPAMALQWGEFVVGFSYLWEGQVQLGENVVQPALAKAEADLGRRNPLTCMLAVLLAATVYERGRLNEVAALLANRLDVLERAGIPETVLLGYRTAARVAAAQGFEHRALDLLEALHAVGVAQKLPRLCVASLAEQIRMHAGRFRSETCQALAERIDGIIARADRPQEGIWWRSVEMLQVLSHANAAMAAKDWRGALEALPRAAALAEAMKRNRERIEIMALQAYAFDRIGENGRRQLQEALTLAHLYGLTRTIVDAHPALADWARRVAGEGAGGMASGGAVPVAWTIQLPTEREAAAPRAVASMVLTLKEREVLELLARKLSNKEIAQAMGVGEATIKWHLKNLFGKLDVGTRKHVVHRARLLGLLEGTE